MLLAIHAPGYASCRYEGHITDDDRICDKPAAIPDCYNYPFVYRIFSRCAKEAVKCEYEKTPTA